MDSFVVGGCIVYYFSYQYIIVVFIIEIEFIVNFDFMGRVNQDILKMGFVVEFVQEEYFDVCIGFFFFVVQMSGEYFGIIENYGIVFIKVFEDVFKCLVFDFI